MVGGGGVTMTNKLAATREALRGAGAPCEDKSTPELVIIKLVIIISIVSIFTRLAYNPRSITHKQQTVPNRLTHFSAGARWTE